MAKRRSDCKYRPKYSKQLREGLRSGGMTKAQCCQKWDIVEATYDNWVNTIPTFAEAVAIGDRDFKIWWEMLGQKGAMGEVKINAGVYCFVMERLNGYTSKSSVQDAVESIGTININVLQAPQKQLEKIETVDVTPVETNVIQIADVKK